MCAGLCVACVICVLLVAALAAAGADPQTKLARLDPVRTVHLGTVNQASDAGLYGAIEKGYFAELGLKIGLVTFAKAATMIAPLGSGEPDVGGGAVSVGLWNADLRGVGLRAVAHKGSTRPGRSYFGLVAKKDGPVQRREDLQGKTISNASLSNGVLHAIDLWLGKCALSLAAVEVKMLGYPEVVPALLNGGIAAGHLAEALVCANLKNGTIRLLARQDEMRPVDQVAVLYFSKKFRADGAAARRFMVGHVRGIQNYLAAYAKGAPAADWFIDVMMKYVRVNDRSVFASATPAGLDPWGRMDLAAMRSDFEWFKARRLIASSDAAFEGPIDTSFVAGARPTCRAREARPRNVSL